MTEFTTFLLLAIGLSFDSFAVSISCGVVKREIKFSQAIVVAGSLAFFQAFMPLAGWLAGKTVHSLIASVDHWIAFALLLIIGVRMIYEGARQKTEPVRYNPLKWKVLLGLSIATSLDALAVGLSFGIMEVSMLYPVIILGAVTFLAAMLGMLSGKKISGMKAHRSIVIGGIILISIGFKILFEHLWM